MKKIFSNTAVLSALLIFVGYLNVYIYYNEFGINISTYLTTGELLLSFLPLTIPLLILASLFVWPIVDVLTTPQSKSKENPERTYERLKPKDIFRYALRNLNSAIKVIRQRRIKHPIKFLLFTLLELTRLVFGFAYQFFFFSFIPIFIVSVFASDYRFVAPIAAWIFLTILWFLFFEDLVKKEDRNPEILNSMSALVAGVLFLGLVSIHNKDKAWSALSGKQEFTVRFMYDSLHIKTDTNLVYIGKTNEYLFLRDRNLNTNKIFEIGSVKSLEYTEVLNKKN